MCEIATDMDKLTNVISRLKDAGDDPKALDLCMAPGGFAGAVLRAIRNATVCGITLPVENGGHPMTMPLWETNQRLQTLWLDITMLAAEMGVSNISPDHPEASKFSSSRPFEGQEFDLVFCDGNVLRTQKRETYRDLKERVRLLTSQLVLAMQRIKAGGSLIIRFHKLEAVDTAILLRDFAKFSSITLMKPTKHHAMRSSFYMIAQDVQPQHSEARRAVLDWKNQWYKATIDTNERDMDTRAGENVDDDKVTELLDSFGPQLIALGEPIWGIQADGLRKSQFIRGDNRTRPYPHPHSSQASRVGHGQPFATKPSTPNPWLAGDPRRDQNNDPHELAGDMMQDNWSAPGDGKLRDWNYPLGNRFDDTPNPWLNMKPRWTPSTPSTTDVSFSRSDYSQEASVDASSDVSSLLPLTGSHQGKKPSGSLLELARQKARPSQATSAHVWRPEKSAAIPIRNPDGEVIDPKEFASITPPKKQAVTLKDANGNKVDLADLKAKSPPHFI
jgi:23S rRNA U2552 (ribose-2'-O)-methylase RlmE/FtsJ